MAHDECIHSGVLFCLGQMAEELCESLSAGGDDVLVHVAPSPSTGLEIGLLPLEGRAPADVLLGTVAPDEWYALGVAARAWASSLDDRADGAARQRTAVSVLVHRSGGIVSRLRIGDGYIDEAPTHGLTLDGLQRAMGLPTAPPLRPTADHFATVWLENIIRAVHPLGWTDVCRLHPAYQLMADHDAATLDPGDLVATAKAMERVIDWERLRWLTVEGLWLVAHLTPTDAAWCDAGAFSRWATDRAVPIDVLLAEVRLVEGAGTARRCAGVLQRLGVPFRGRRRPAA